jgi:hypothetical protein
MRRLIFLLLLLVSWGNIYSQTDYAELEWVRTYIGPDSINSISKGMVLDKKGNIYVAIDDRAINDSSRSNDYVLVKYDIEGNEKWTARYAGTKSLNRIEAMNSDNQGNIYLACSFQIGIDLKYVALKYNPEGALQWENILNADDPPVSKPAKIAVDDSGNVYMASHTMDVYKYDINGKLIWNTPRGIPSGIIYVYSMALDSEANVYLAGKDFILKYNSDGVKQWEASDTLAPRDILVNDNYVYICGAIGLSKYSKEGAEQWTRLYGEDFYSIVHFTIDNSRNPILLGSYYNGFYEQHAIIKYNSEGIRLWDAFAQEPTSTYLFSGGIGDICHDKFGNIYIIRYSAKVNSGSDISVIKFSSSGEQKWIMHYTGYPDTYAWEEPNLSVKVDPLGNVYATGMTLFRERQEQVVTIKYSQPNFPVSVVQEKVNNNSFQLLQNYPNPFNPNTNIKYSLKETGKVQIDIINIQGQIIKRLLNEEKSPGVYNAVWNGRTDKGYPAASGIYICRLLVKPDLSGIQVNRKSIKLLLLK